MNYPEKKDEKIRDIFVKDIVKDKLNVKVDSSEIQAIHRIPGKIGEARPVKYQALSSSLQFLSLVPILCFVTSSTSLTVSFLASSF
jgi:hypothetical protein